MFLTVFSRSSDLGKRSSGPPIRQALGGDPAFCQHEHPEQEFFSDGITEDIITDLSKISGLFVLSRNTVFTYKSKAVAMERIAKELGGRLSGRGQRPQGRAEGPSQRSVDRRRNGWSFVGRPLRS
jgi:adenylate cyclase